MSAIVETHGLVKRYAGTVAVAGIDLTIEEGEIFGLVGPNGAGKTTLLRLAAGIDEPDEGSVHRKRGLALGLLSQEAHFDAAFMAAPDLRAAVRQGASHLEVMGEELATLEREHRVEEPRYADLQHRFETLGGYTLDQRVDETLSGLGFARDEWTKPPTALSGGEQTRAALARLVIADPELLLLDEPTNHLDLEALEWLEQHLRRRSGSLLVASHDRAFLDATVDRIWELRDRRLTAFRGDYSAYHRQREERDARQVKDVESQTDQIARERELVQRFRSHRKFAQMHEHEARLERLQADRVEAPKAGRKLRLPSAALAGTGPVRSGELAVRIEGLVAGYFPRRTEPRGDAADPSAGLAPQALPKPVVTVPFLAAQRGERIGIVGPNGAGKTTLLRTVAGELPPLDGVLAFGHNVSLGYLAQLRGAAIPGTTVLDALLEAIPITPGEARSYLARFLFRGDDALKEVRSLSGGERSRLELALLGIMPANLLLLDEPTNHLDIPAREAIESFMADTPATLLVVSHDRRLLETVCERLWVVGDGLAVAFDGGYRAWRSAVAGGWTVAAAVEQEAQRLRSGQGRGRPAGGDATRARAGDAGTATAGTRSSSGRQAAAAAAASGASASSVATATAAPSRTSPRRGGKREKLSKDAYRRQKTAVEADLTRLGLRKSHLELAMGDPAVQANFVELRRIGSELADIEAGLAAAEDAWLEIEERAP
ncbi:MAG TPA: ABC-F family ATP-binding cassette domain-containing protein [Candidatus Limnocylindrales bacterium]